MHLCISRTTFSLKAFGPWLTLLSLANSAMSQILEAARMINGHKVVEGMDTRTQAHAHTTRKLWVGLGNMSQRLLLYAKAVPEEGDSQCAKAGSRPPPFQVTHSSPTSHLPLHISVPFPSLRTVHHHYVDEFTLPVPQTLLHNLGRQIAQYNLV